MQTFPQVYDVVVAAAADVAERYYYYLFSNIIMYVIMHCLLKDEKLSTLVL